MKGAIFIVLSTVLSLSIGGGVRLSINVLIRSLFRGFIYDEKNELKGWVSVLRVSVQTLIYFVLFLFSLIFCVVYIIVVYILGNNVYGAFRWGCIMSGIGYVIIGCVVFFCMCSFFWANSIKINLTFILRS